MNKIRKLEFVLKAVANHRRLSILEFLKKRQQATVGGIADAIKLSFTSTSKHLRLLDHVGILAKEQNGLEVRYSIEPTSEHIVKKVIEEL